MEHTADMLKRLSAMGLRSGLAGEPNNSGKLHPLIGFGSNPGGLKAFSYTPVDLPPGAPLVVVLHGCTQDAASYDRGSGWSQLADRYGFAVLFPEQCRSNNANLCFNWFEPADSRRGSGEPLSIIQMIRAMVEQHTLNAQRVFVTGLSAGGAMTSNLLATYPDVFAGGAIIAGLPYGSARTMPEAFERMRGHGNPCGAALRELVLRASEHEGPWPSVAVWHGSADPTVNVSNALSIIEQWQGVHRVGTAPDEAGLVNGHLYRAWRDPDGRIVVEDYRISGMGHGTPLATQGKDGCGSAGAYMLEVGISSSLVMARSWGLTEVKRERKDERVALPPASVPPPWPPSPASFQPNSGIQDTIENALRAAGLMR